jgi:hypothetical protein
MHTDLPGSRCPHSAWLAQARQAPLASQMGRLSGHEAALHTHAVALQSGVLPAHAPHALPQCEASFATHDPEQQWLVPLHVAPSVATGYSQT